MMFSRSSLALTALLGTQVLAQLLLPTELSPYFQVTTALESTFSGITLTKPGQLIATADTKTAPTIDVQDGLSSTPPYLFMMVDPSYNASVPTNVVLHTIVANITALSGGAPIHELVSASSPALAAYIGPQPPAGKPTHNYTLLVFAQPKGFVVPTAFDSFLPLNLSNVYSRVNFPLLDFVKDGNLGNPVAANWFRLNLTSSTNSTASSNSSGNAGSASAASSGVPAPTSPITVSDAAHSEHPAWLLSAAWTAVVVVAFQQLII